MRLVALTLKTILKLAKHVWVKLEHLLGHAIKRHPTYLPCQLHLEEVKEHGHAGSNVEKWTQDLKSPHHCLTVMMKLGRCHVYMLQQGTLKGVQRKGQVQNLEQAAIYIEEGWTT